MTCNTEQNDIKTWLENAGRYPLLPQQRTIAIGKQIQALPEGSAKRRKLVNTLVKHNLRFVVKYVSNFMNGSCHHKWGSAETVDYLQTGVFGLIRAAEMYDPARGYTFTTYSVFWIRSFVNRYNMKSLSAVSVSESAFREIIFYKRNGYLKLRNGERDTSNKKIREVTRLVNAAYQCVSLNMVNENDHELIELIGSKDTGNQEELSYEKAIEMLDSAGISDIGKEILISCFIEKQTVTEVANRLGLSVYQVRTLKKQATSLAKSRPEAFDLSPADIGILSGNTAPSGETQWLQSLSSVK